MSITAGKACTACSGQGQVGRLSKKKPATLCAEPCRACTGTGVLAGPSPQRALPHNSDWDVDVAIVGCGVGGSALALALQQRGISVRVYERDAEFAQRKQGYGLTMQQGAIALARLGIAVAGTTSLAHVSFLPDGTVIGCYGRELDDRAATVNDSDVPVIQKSHKMRHNIQIPRQRLRAMLVHRLDPTIVEWGAKYESFAEDADGVTVNFAGRPPVRAGVLVGADGIFSPVRQQKYGHIKEYDLKYLGVIVVLGIVPNTTIESLHRRVTQTLDGDTRIFTMPFTSSTDPEEEVDVVVHRAAYFDQERFRPRTDVVMWQLSFRCTEEEAKALGKGGGEVLKAEALRRCGHWHHPVPELLLSTNAADITGYPAYDRDVLRDVNEGGSQSRVTVIGDAAHCMSPFKGQGANQALVDAIGLAKTLSTAFGPYRSPGIELRAVPELLRQFEREMLVRAGEKVEMSRNAAAFLHSKDALVVGNCVRSAASFERKSKLLTEDVKSLEEARRKNAKMIFHKQVQGDNTRSGDVRGKAEAGMEIEPK